MHCTNNLKQIGLAMHNYHGNNDRFPDGATASVSAGCYSWYTAVLPFMELNDLYEQLDPDGDGRIAANLNNEPAILSKVTVFRCPTDPGEAFNPNYEDFPTANYKVSRTMFNAPSNSMGWPSHIRMKDIADGTSCTFLAAEHGLFEGSTAGTWSGQIRTAGSFNFCTTRPINTPFVNPVHTKNKNGKDCISVSGSNDRTYSRFTVTSQHPGGANFLFCDGSVHFIAEDIETNPNLIQIGVDFTSSTAESGDYAYQNLINYADGNLIPAGLY